MSGTALVFLAMWPGQQPPGGEQNPQAQNNPYQQPGYQQPNPYQQPGYQQQPNPYAQQPQWGAPAPVGAPTPPPGGSGSGGGGGNRTKLVAIVAASAVVVAAGVTGFLVLGGDDDEAAPVSKGSSSPSVSGPASASASSSSGTDDNPRNGEAEKPTIAGWKVVVNPKWGIAFDVPADWEVQSPGLSQGFEWEDKKKKDGYDRILQGGTAEFKSKWCSVDSDKDGKVEDTALAMVGSKGAEGAKSTDEIAINTPAWWVFGGYTEPDKKSITFDKKATPFTTASGVKGSYAWAQSTNTPQKGKCDSDGKAITFGFKNSNSDYVSWNLYGAKGVKDELPKATIMQILSTVRLHGTPTQN